MNTQQGIFLIDWDAERGASLASRLEVEGWAVELESSDGGRAYRRIRGASPRAVVVVASSKVGHGLQTALSLRKARATQSLPILFVDAGAEAEERLRGAVAGSVFTTTDDLVRTLRELAQGQAI